MAWFRFYDEVADDPKVQRLSPILFRAWVNFMCLAKRNGGVLPGVENLAYGLRVTVAKAQAFQDELTKVELIDQRTDGTFEMHNWTGRQFQSDVSTGRVQRFRERQRNVSETAKETDQNRTDTEQIQNRTDTEPGKTSRKTRAPSELLITDTMLQWAGENKITANLDTETAAMLDYHRSKGNMHSDWIATWRTWMRNTKKFQGANGDGQHKSRADITRESCEQVLDLLDRKASGGGKRGD